MDERLEINEKENAGFHDAWSWFILLADLPHLSRQVSSLQQS